jgi:hypothetical protein
MKRRIALLFIFLLTVELICFQNCKITTANPVPYPTTPNQELPTLKVDSPSNGEVFTSTTIRLNFTITIPDSWNAYWLTTMPIIGDFDVDVYLDGNLKYTERVLGSPDVLTYNYSIVLDGLTAGEHSAKILVTARTFFQPKLANNGREYLGDFYETRDFKIQPFPTIQVAVILVIIAVISIVSVVYFKKHKSRTTSVKKT